MNILILNHKLVHIPVYVTPVRSCNRVLWRIFCSTLYMYSVLLTKAGIDSSQQRLKLSVGNSCAGLCSYNLIFSIGRYRTLYDVIVKYFGSVLPRKVVLGSRFP